MKLLTIHIIIVIILIIAGLIHDKWFRHRVNNVWIVVFIAIIGVPFTVSKEIRNNKIEYRKDIIESEEFHKIINVSEQERKYRFTIRVNDGIKTINVSERDIIYETDSSLDSDLELKLNSDNNIIIRDVMGINK